MEGTVGALVHLAVAGATLGVAMDAVHVWNGVHAYPTPTSLGVAWWTFPLYACASAGLGLVPLLFMGASTSALQFERAMVAFCVAYLLSSVLRGWACALCMLAFAALNWKLADKCSNQGLMHSAAAAVAGTAVEIVLVRQGAFRHFETTLLGAVPLWLPLLYMAASPAVRSYASFLVHGRK
jgi:hypothetical protein